IKFHVMDTTKSTAITIQTDVNLPVATVWNYWTSPEHIVNWNNASDDWHTPYADNDVRVNGKFKSTMAARDGSASFDFEGVYTEVKEDELNAYRMSDGREVRVTFSEEGGATRVVETFDPEDMNSADMQKAGWQSILDNFRRYAESQP